MAHGTRYPAEGSRLGPAWLAHHQAYFKLLLVLSALGKTRCHGNPIWEPAAAQITKGSKDWAETLGQVGHVIVDLEPAVAQHRLQTKWHNLVWESSFELCFTRNSTQAQAPSFPRARICFWVPPWGSTHNPETQAWTFWGRGGRRRTTDKNSCCSAHPRPYNGQYEPTRMERRHSQSSLKYSTQVSAQHASGFNKLLLNQPDLTSAVGDEKSGSKCAGQHRSPSPPSHGRLCPCLQVLCNTVPEAKCSSLCSQAPTLFCRWLWFENSQLSLLPWRKTSRARN